jgi:putative methyltransferase
LREAVERHKARLKAEFTKIRLRGKCVTVDELRKSVEQEMKTDGPETLQPRWVRVNTAITSLNDQFATTFYGYSRSTLEDVRKANPQKKILHVDEHIPDLLAVPPRTDLTTNPAYKRGDVILQDKASCIPAYLLVGSMAEATTLGDIIDACAAPGNKTTHLAALLSSSSSHTLGPKISSRPTIFAVERDGNRSTSLQDTINRTGTSDVVKVLPGQDFLALNPKDKRFANVTAILLDPSCSGSGIIGREDIPTISLPEDPRKSSNSKSNSHQKTNNKKRKRHPSSPLAQEPRPRLPSPQQPDKSRLVSLSNLQTHLLTHAFSFPAATNITYSTCSLDYIENEGVVSRTLRTPVALERGWRVLRRDEQVNGMRRWGFRGIRGEQGDKGAVELEDEEREGCLRCWPPSDDRDKGEGTMGFFVVGFVREGDGDRSGGAAHGITRKTLSDGTGAVEQGDTADLDHDYEDEEQEWEGFGD